MNPPTELPKSAVNTLKPVLEQINKIEQDLMTLTNDTYLTDLHHAIKNASERTTEVEVEDVDMEEPEVGLGADAGDRSTYQPPTVEDDKDADISDKENEVSAPVSAWGASEAWAESSALERTKIQAASKAHAKQQVKLGLDATILLRELNAAYQDMIEHTIKDIEALHGKMTVLVDDGGKKPGTRDLKMMRFDEAYKAWFDDVDVVWADLGASLQAGCGIGS